MTRLETSADMMSGSGPEGSVLPYCQNIDGCLHSEIGEHGLSERELSDILAELAPAMADLRQAHGQAEGDCSLPLLRICGARDDIDVAAAALARLSEGARTIIFFGTGGSSLGGQTLAQLAGWNIPGDMRGSQTKRPRTRFYDNLDARTLQGALASLDLASTRFIVISKSGNTPETLAQTIAAMQAAKQVVTPEQLSSLFLGVTEPAMPNVKNGLRALFEVHDMALLDHPIGIGGRFSVFSIVGLLSALARGMDVAAFRGGGEEVIRQLLDVHDPSRFAPALGAAVSVGLARYRGIRINVMMPYGDRLARFAHWYAQLWGESLGKDGLGMTPVAALGPVDQHSQLQLYMDGPRDHMITFMREQNGAPGPELDDGLCRQAGLDVLAGRHVGEFVNAQTMAVPQALIAAGRPVRVFDIPELDERALGGVMMHFMIETILAARLLGVDPFGQPAVETGKQLALQLLASRR